MTPEPPRDGTSSAPRAPEQQQDHLVLLVTGSSPRSQRARSNLQLGLHALEAGAVQVDEVDLLMRPLAALDFGVYASPALLWQSDGRANAVLYGDLSDERALRHFLAALPLS